MLKRCSEKKDINEWNEWAEADLNRRHTDFQSVALPTELSARNILL
jgi:hypothetical protein